MISRTRYDLTTEWSFKQTDEAEDAWLSVKSVPTEVHLDLLAHNIIADPFKDLNELSTHWVADQSWTYRTKIQVPSKPSPDSRTDLVFEGLDTFATVSVNGKVVLKTENAFLEHRIPNLPAGEDMDLEITFESARKKGLDLVKEHPEHRFIAHQTEVSRAPVRKPQYHWGWDWGPVLTTCGLWKPIYLETYVSRVTDLGAQYELDENLKKVSVSAFASISGTSPSHVNFKLTGSDGEFIADSTGEVDKEGLYKGSFEVVFPRLWWPRGYGSQSTYKLSVTITGKDEEILDEKTQHIGFRRTELIKEADSSGESFYFRINNVDVFVGGSCWIPADSFTSRISPDRYRDWVKLAADGNQTMIRVWGGGIYEPDAFYEACDDHGILVWQDFMFACASYPTYPSYLSSVEEEARQTVRRLRHHPSLIIWAGNNEDYQLVERYNLEYNYAEDKDPQSWLKSNFPARYIYEHLLPNIVSTESPSALYHPSSPWGNGTSTTLKVDPIVGDIHQWNVWHGTMQPIQDLPKMGGRFVSEFGMEAFPHISTLERIASPDQLYPGSMVLEYHNKAIGHSRRLNTYITENYRLVSSLAGYTHLSQILQADALSLAYKSWRRDWNKASHRKCGGVLVWQLNDCYPTISWSIVDYDLVPKPAYYALRRALAPIAVNVVRQNHNWRERPADALWQRDTAHIDPTRGLEQIFFDTWVTSSERKAMQGVLTVRFVSVRSGDEVRKAIERKVNILPNGTTEVLVNKMVPVPVQDSRRPFDVAQADPFVIHVALSVGGREVSTDTAWPEPIKYLIMSERGVSVVKAEAEDGVVVVSAEKPVKGFVFSERKGILISDNSFDLMPWERRRVVVDGEKNEEVAKNWTYTGRDDGPHI